MTEKVKERVLTKGFSHFRYQFDPLSSLIVYQWLISYQVDWVSAECLMLFPVPSWFYRNGFRLCSTCYPRFVFFFASLDEDTKGSDNSMFLIIVLLTEPPTWLYATDKHLIVIFTCHSTVQCIRNDRFEWTDTQYWKRVWVCLRARLCSLHWFILLINMLVPVILDSFCPFGFREIFIAQSYSLNFIHW